MIAEIKMIIPNLMVTNMPASLAFYRDFLGMTVTIMISADRKILPENEEPQAVFATLEMEDSQLMLQTVDSLSKELDVFSTQSRPTPSGTIYFRNLHPDKIKAKISENLIIKGPVLQWYGMMELYISDPDGYIICIGAPEGSPPS